MTEEALNFERQEDAVQTTINVGKKLFTLDGMLERVLEKARMAMSGRSDRGPDPDAVNPDEERILVPVHWLERSFRRSSNGPGSVNGWSTWVLGIVGALIVASVLGLTSAMFTMTGRMATLEAKMDMLLKDRK